MKKTLFTLVAVPLVLLPVILLASCYLSELFLDADAEPPMARLAINVGDGGASRALTTALAKDLINGVNYYEVVFKYGPRLYQVAWDTTSYPTASPSITIPVGNYSTVNNDRLNDAVLFAGKRVPTAPNGYDFTLLAVGELYSTYDGSTTTTDTKEITTETTSVTFRLTALKNNVGGDVSNPPNTSTFKITGPTEDDVKMLNYATADSNNSNVTNSLSAIPLLGTGNDIPVFPIPGTGYPNPPNNPGVGTISATYNVTVPHESKVILLANWGVTNETATVEALPGAAVTGTVTFTPIDKNIGVPLDATTTFTFTINVSACTADGLCAIAINVPVCALSNTAPFVTGSRVIWNIRGGTDKANPDKGTDNGAAVILAVGTEFFSP